MESHLVIAFAGILFVFVLCMAAAYLGRTANKLSDSLGPLPHSVLSLVNGLQSSIAANHGWVYLGDEVFIEQNEKSWLKIKDALLELEQAQQQNPEIFSSQELEDIRSNLSQLSDLQSGIAFVPGEELRPAIEIFEQEVLPLKVQIDALFEEFSWLNSEFDYPQIADYLATAEKQFTETFLQLELSIKSREYQDSDRYTEARSNLLQNFQAETTVQASSEELVNLLQALGGLVRRFATQADEALLNHEANSNNQVRQFLFERAVPLSNNIIGMLQKLESKASHEILRHREEMRQVTSFTLVSAFIALAGLVMAAVVVSINNAKQLLGRLTSLSRALEDFTEGNRSSRLKEEGDDEITSLTRMFNKMVVTIEEKQRTVRSYQNDLECRVESRTRELFKSKELAETTLRSIGDALITVDRDCRISMFNPAAERLLRIRADKALGMPVMSVLAFDGPDNIMLQGSSVERCIERNELFQPEEVMYLYRSADEKVPVKINAAPIAGERNNVDGAIVIIRDVTRELALQAELSYQANHDQLTGLANRARFNHELNRVLKTVREKPGKHTLAFLDLDKFKNVNDTGGHAAGDELLQQLAVLLGDNLRPADLLARLGGDEFAVIFRDCSVEQALKVSRKLRDLVSGYRFAWQGNTFRVGVSIGLVEVNGDVLTLSDIMSQADAACYAAKKAGRNTIRVANAQNADTLTDFQHHDEDERIAKALAGARFEVMFNDLDPVCAGDCERFRRASLQLRDQQDQLLKFDEFSPVADRLGQMAQLDLVLLDQVLSLLADQQQSCSAECVPVIMDIATESFEDADFVAGVEQRLYDRALPHGLILFSISESVLHGSSEKISRLFEGWNQLGVRVVLKEHRGDLAGLLDLSMITYLAIDDSLACDITVNPVHRTLVKAITDLAHLTGKRTMASASPHSPAFQGLRELGVDYVLPKRRPVSLSRSALLSSGEPGLLKAG
ncbi:MAG: diguanylate cyclase [Gammaproteobacteria bacterium]|nr:diguanylate cyclase [Gammaproteobacteria bacterium]